MGISDEELEGLSSDMMEAMQSLTGGGDSLMEIENNPEDSDDEGKTATFPFLNRLFGNQNPPAERDSAADRGDGGSRPRENGDRKSKQKFLNNYCISLTKRAREGKLDEMVGRNDELERVVQILEFGIKESLSLVVSVNASLNQQIRKPWCNVQSPSKLCYGFGIARRF
jgi:ATP-dependent Clp protease ATP-binding subunit ClpA